MNTARLSLKLYKNNWEYNIIMIFILIVCFFVISICSYYIDCNSYQYNLIKDYDDSFLYYSHPSEISNPDNISYDDALEIINELRGFKYVHESYYRDIILDGDIVTHCLASLSIINGINWKVRSGKNKIDYNDKYNEVIVSFNFNKKIGSIFEIDGVKYKVVGVLDKRSAYISMNSYNYPTTAEVFFKDIYDNTPFFISDIKSIEIIETKNNLLIEFDNIDEEILTENLTILRSYGRCETLEKIKENTLVERKENFHYIMPIIIMTVLVSLICIIIISIVSSLKNIRMYSLLYINGATSGKINLINIIYYFNSVIVTFILTIIMVCIINYLQGDYRLDIRYSYIYIVYFVLSLIISTLLSRKFLNIKFFFKSQKERLNENL